MEFGVHVTFSVSARTWISVETDGEDIKKDIEKSAAACAAAISITVPATTHWEISPVHVEIMDSPW